MDKQKKLSTQQCLTTAPSGASSHLRLGNNPSSPPPILGSQQLSKPPPTPMPPHLTHLPAAWPPVGQESVGSSGVVGGGGRGWGGGGGWWGLDWEEVAVTVSD